MDFTTICILHVSSVKPKILTTTPQQQPQRALKHQQGDKTERQKDRKAGENVENLKCKKRIEGANFKKNSSEACWVMVYDEIT